MTIVQIDQDKSGSLYQRCTHIPVKCLICASRLVPVSAKISEALIPCRSSTTYVSCTGFPDCVSGVALVVLASVRRVAKEGALVVAILGDVRASWRRRSVVAIFVAGVEGENWKSRSPTVYVVVVWSVGCKRITLIRSLGKIELGRIFLTHVRAFASRWRQL